MPEELDKPGVDNNQLEDCDRVSEFERIIYRQGFAISYVVFYSIPLFFILLETFYTFSWATNQGLILKAKNGATKLR